MNSSDFGKKVEIVLLEMGISQRDFATRLGFSHGIVSSWKSMNKYPSVDTVLLVAKELQVSPEWLFTGDIDFETNDSVMRNFSRKAIRLRVYESLRDYSLSKNPNCSDFSEDYLSNEDILRKLHNKYFIDYEGINSKSVSYEALLNWSKGRCEIDVHQFTHWAIELNTSISYILTGMGNDTDNIPSSAEKSLLDVAKEYRNELNCLKCLSPERKQLAVGLLRQLKALEDVEFKEKH